MCFDYAVLLGQMWFDYRVLIGLMWNDYTGHLAHLLGSASALENSRPDWSLGVLRDMCQWQSD